MTVAVTFVSYDDTPPQGGQGVELDGMRRAVRQHDIAVTTLSGRGDHALSFPRRTGRAPLDFSLHMNRRLDLIDDTDPDVVHALGGPGGVLITRRPHAPLIYTANHTYRQAHRRGRPQRMLVLAERRSYQLAERILAISESTAHAVRDLGIPGARIEVVPPGVDADTNVDDSQRDPHRILFVGRLEPEKGVLDALDVMQVLAFRDPATTGVVIGSGSLEATVRRRALGSKGRIEFLGRVDDDRRIAEMRRAAVVLQPSLYEGLGLVALEAMGRGAVVIGYQVDGLIDSIPASGGGALVPVGARACLAEEVGMLFRDPGRRTEMASAGHAWVLANHSWAGVGERVATLYRDVTGIRDR